ncbi:MAG: BON domain-containing protein [Rickettsiales bacterium]|nr:BON domain-containing protein [Rickettsiales bacterium]
MNKLILNLFYLTLALFSLSGCLQTVFTGAAGSAVELAKDRGAKQALTDARISAGIKADLIKSGVREYFTKIKVDVVDGRVLLTGAIEKDADALKAVEIAWNQKDVEEVVNELKVNEKSDHFSLAQYTRDVMITSQIKSKTFINRQVKFVNYTIVTVDNVVYIFGIARSEEELAKVADISSNVRGVERVVSHVKIKPLDANKLGDDAISNQSTKSTVDDDDKITTIKAPTKMKEVKTETSVDKEAVKDNLDDW